MKLLISMAALVGTLAMLPMAATATTYSGNGATGFGGTLGNGSLQVTSNSSGSVTFTLNSAFTNLSGNGVVIYIDSVAGGFNNTSTFSDNGDAGRETISGFNAGNPSRTLLQFPTGFNADYALSFEDGFAGLFGLASGGNNSLTFVSGTGQSGTSPYTVTISGSDFGFAPGDSFNFVGSLISTSAYRSNETLGTSTTTPEPGAAPNAGFNGTTTFTAFDTFASAPEPGSLLPMLMGVASLGGLIIARRRRMA